MKWTRESREAKRRRKEESLEKKDTLAVRESRQWHYWFAWFPVMCGEKDEVQKWVWLELVYRRNQNFVRPRPFDFLTKASLRNRYAPNWCYCDNEFEVLKQVPIED